MDPLSLAGIGWGVSAASWLISPVLSRLVNKCFDVLGKNHAQRKALDERLEDLHTKLLPQLIILTDAAKKSPYRRDLEDWLQKLKSAYYEAEHLLGLVEYTQLEKKANDLFPSTSKHNFWYDFDFNNIVLNSRKKDLLKSLKKLENIVDKEASKLIDLLKLPTTNVDNSNPRPIENPSKQSNETISGLGGLEVIGRDKDRKQIKNLLRKEIPGSSDYNAKCFSVIGIWGMGGSGKTTLAQYVCEYEKKDSTYFDLVIWAYVSQNFSVKSIYKKILESLHEKPEYDSIEGLYSQLKKKLKEKRFLLVLDDAWCDEGVSERQFQQLFAPLQDAKRGSKILVTTRIENAAKALGATELIPLRQLDEGEFLELFMSYALRDLTGEEKNIKITLEQIGEQIAAKLHKSPLAATTVAALLRANLNPDFWLSMLDENLLNKTMGVLLLSYQNLPPPLQRCFAICSLFPKGHKFSQDHLVSLWIGEGFIETEGSNRHVRDIGNDYILKLISCSFLQVVERETYIIHDLLHDLGEEISKPDCFRVEVGGLTIPSETRHLYVKVDIFEEYISKICKLKDLRTIIIGSWNMKKIDLDPLFKGSKKFYVVDLTDNSLDGWPKSMFSLENLRYLNYGATDVTNFSKLFTRLYQLRLLRGKFGFISSNKLSQIPNIGRLSLLQDMPVFQVTKERGRGLEQLEHLRDLYGELYIYGLINVNSSEGARQSILSDKKGLRKLNLRLLNNVFSINNYLDDINSLTRMEDTEVILDKLRPPLQLEKLTIDGYSGKRCPIWFSEYNKNTTHLKELILRHCPFLEALPETNNLIHLQSLTIRNLNELKWWAPLPKNLVNLKLYRCNSLAFLSEEELKIRMSTRSGEQSPIDKELEKVYIYEMYLARQKKLDSICQVKEVNRELHLPLTLKRLTMHSCFISDKILASSLQDHTLLTDLRLSDIIPITCIAREVLSSLINLRILIIRECLMLTAIGGLETLSSLEHLSIEECPCLTIESLDLSNSKSLHDLSLKNCTNLVSLMGLNELNNLEYLTVIGCDKLQCSSDASKLPGVRQTLAISKLSLLKLISRDGLSSLRSLRIKRAEQEYFTQEECEMLSHLSSLETIQFENGRIQSLPDLSCLRSVTKLDILRCKHLTSLSELPPSLQSIDISDCPTIQSLDLSNYKSLHDLHLRDCTNLVSFMGLNELNNLMDLSVVRCDKLQCSSDASKLPGVRQTLAISKLSLLKLISRDGLSSLRSLRIKRAEQEYFTQKECEMLSHLSSLETIQFQNCRIQSLPDLSCLRSVTRLDILWCKHLTSLSELPPSLQSIHISYCNDEFTRSCEDTNHPNGQKISRIQEVFYLDWVMEYD